MSRMRVAAAFAVCVLVLGTADLVQAQVPAGSRVAYVNIQAVLAAAPAAKAAEAQWAAESQVLQVELNGMIAELDSLTADYEMKASTMAPEARLAREQLIQQKNLALTTRNEEMTVQADQRMTELVSPVYEQIGEVVEEVRVEGNYALILDSNGQVIIAADPALDLTDTIIARLQAPTPDSGGTDDGASPSGGGTSPQG